MRLIPNDVRTLAMGLAASMGQFLLSAARRASATPCRNARILMHQGSAGIGGTAVDIEIQAENLERTKRPDRAADRRAHRPDRRDRSSADGDRDRWFTRRGGRGSTASSTRSSSRSTDVRPAGLERDGWGCG